MTLFQEELVLKLQAEQQIAMQRSDEASRARQDACKVRMELEQARIELQQAASWREDAKRELAERSRQLEHLQNLGASVEQDRNHLRIVVEQMQTQLQDASAEVGRLADALQKMDAALIKAQAAGAAGRAGQ